MKKLLYLIGLLKSEEIWVAVKDYENLETDYAPVNKEYIYIKILNKKIYI